MSDAPTPTGVLAGIADDDWQAWLAQGQIVPLSEGDVIFNEGDPGDAVYLVNNGHLQITVKRADGSAIVLADAQRGDLVGEHYLFVSQAGGRRGSTVRSSQSGSLIRWSGQAFLNFIAHQPGLAERLRNRAEERESGNLARRGQILRTLAAMDAVDPTDIIRLSAGSKIFDEGEEGDAAYVVVAGVVEIVRASKQGGVLLEAGAGQCFGERALLTRDRRSASARAKTEVVLLRLWQQRFLQLQSKSEVFRALIEGVDFVYRLPARGMALTYASEHDGLPSVERLYRLDDGRRVRSTWVPQLKVFVLRSLLEGRSDPLPVARTLVWPSIEESMPLGAMRRALLLGPDGRLLGLDGGGDWSDLPWLIERTVDGDQLSAREEEIFLATGRVRRPTDNATVGDANAIVCRCLGVSAGNLKDKIAAGCSSLSTLQSVTGCGTVCGGCVPALKSMLGQGEWVPVQVLARGGRQGDDVQAYRLLPDWPMPEPWKTGQHIVVSGRIDGHWISRSYTLTAPPAPSAAPEIAVKREPYGYFSRWLLDGDPILKEVRVGMPRGAAVWTPEVPDTVCFVAGIGVTPALAIVRAALGPHSLAADACSIHIDYTGRHLSTMAFVEELQAAAASLSGLTLRLRESAKEGRLMADEVAQVVGSHPHALYFVCGPIPYMDAVVQTLRSAGVPDGAIHEERFAHAGAPLQLRAGANGGDGSGLGTLGPNPPGEPVRSRPVFIRRAYQSALMLALLLSVVVNLPWALALWPTGHPTPGHEALTCEDCHRKAPGSARQQLQAKAKHLLGIRAVDVAWHHHPVGNAECMACHDRPKDVHAPHLFMEARYTSVRASLGPENCLSCHREHRARRVTLRDGLFCSACHSDMNLKTDALAPPASPTHATLTREGRWETCLGCHDYHGNHLRAAPNRLDEALSESMIRTGLRGGASPWGEELKVRAKTNTHTQAQALTNRLKQVVTKEGSP